MREKAKAGESTNRGLLGLIALVKKEMAKKIPTAMRLSTVGQAAFVVYFRGLLRRAPCNCLHGQVFVCMEDASMRTVFPLRRLMMVAVFGLGAWGCSKSSGGGGGSGGTTIPTAGSDEAGSGGSSPGLAGSGGASTTVPSGGVTGSGGLRASGGAPGKTGGASSATGGGAAGGAISGRAGASAGTGGTRTGGSGAGAAGSGGAKADAAAATEAGATGADCTVGAWPTADPSAAGPFAIVTEQNVGPGAGVGPDGGAPPQFTLFRPKDMAQGGLCHPVITWGNGTGSNPSMYKVLLNNLASHGFVVIGSNSPNVAQGNPAPMVVGVTWVLQQNDDPTSVMYHRIDTTHVGATGHSQGAMATSQASGDSHITTSVPIEGAMAQRSLHGPATFFCGGQDPIVGCSGAQSALTAVTTLPAMSAEYLSADHGSWLTFMGSKPSPVETAVTAWMRV
ncbi:MAG TPA: hypothetical protein VF518_12060, partial [Polyangia bacterium]